MSAVKKFSEQLPPVLNLLPGTALGQVPGFKAAPGSALLACYLPLLASACAAVPPVPLWPPAKVVFEDYDCQLPLTTSQSTRIFPQSKHGIAKEKGP